MGNDDAVLPDRTDVLIVGAGPTGLLLALELQRRGVDHVLIDLHDEPLTWDRATVVHPRSLELFDALGLVDGLLDTGIPQRFVHLHSDGAELGSLDLSLSGSRYPFNLGVSEEVTERVLTERLIALGGSVQRGAELVALDQGNEMPVDQRDAAPRVTATIVTGGSTFTVAASWVVGCDGFHGVTRRVAGIDEETRDVDRKWVVFDATLEPWFPDGGDTHAFFDEPTTIATSLPGGRWRVYVHTTAGGQDAVTSSRQVLRGYEPRLRYSNVENISAFTCHTKIATSYRSGRVLLAGDAAHVCSPAQGHGMNSGLQDAQNLGWKLALVVGGVASAVLLDSFEAERRPVAELYLQEGADSEGTMAPANATEKRVRNATMRTHLSDPTTRRHESVAEAELDADLRASPIVRGDGERLITGGDRVPQRASVTRTDGRGTLLARALFGIRHTVVLLAGSDVSTSQLATLVHHLQDSVARSEITDRLLVILDERMDEPDQRADSTSTAGTTEVVSIDGDGLDALDVARDDLVVLVVRPDGWIGIRADSDHVNRLTAYEMQLLGA